MRTNSRHLLGLCALLVWALASSSADPQAQGRTSGAASAAAPGATTDIKNADGKTIGTAEFTSVQGGVLVHLELSGAPAGVHALHIHETGRCEGPTFESAGPHFNPTGAQHGFKNTKGAHIGDLPSVHVPSTGTLTLEHIIAAASLTSGRKNLLDADGSALVLHSAADDYMSDPAGNAGDRIACGILQAAKR